MTILDEEAVKLPVIVKPLEWVRDGDGHWKAGALVASYHIIQKPGDLFQLRMSWSLMMFDGQFFSLPEAKAAAQSDYAKRVLSALSPTTPDTRAPGSGETVRAGWRLVPVDPTPEMIGAWYRYKSGFRFPDEEPARDTSDYGAYRAMLASAPSASIGAMGAEPSMWATVVENDYDGELRWDCHTEGDRGDGDSLPTITLAADTFPVGSRLEITEPTLPAETQAGDNEEMKK